MTNRFGKGIFELGNGGVDFPALLASLRKAGCSVWLTVELDSTDTAPKGSAATSERYLEEVLKVPLRPEGT